MGVGISFAEATAPQSAGSFFTGGTRGPHPSPVIQRTFLPGSRNYAELAGSLSAPSLAAQVEVQGLSLASRVDSGTP